MAATEATECRVCNSAMDVPHDFDHETGMCHVCETDVLTARVAELSARLNATETVVALVRSRNCCDGEDAAHTHAMIHALGSLDDAACDVPKGGLKDE